MKRGERVEDRRGAKRKLLHNCSRGRAAIAQACCTATLVHTRPFHRRFAAATAQALSCMPRTLCCTALAQPRAYACSPAARRLCAQKHYIVGLVINKHDILKCILVGSVGGGKRLERAALVATAAARRSGSATC
eukprot:6195183-Pleurochrysis_carterae.AAC.1